MSVPNYVVRWLVPFLVCAGIWVFRLEREIGELYVALIFCMILATDVLAHTQVFRDLEDEVFNQEKEYVFLFWRGVMNTGVGLGALLVIVLRQVP